MPFSQQSYMGGGGEPRQIFDRSGEILGQGLGRGFEILAQAVGKKAEKDEMRKRRKEYVDGMSKALNAIGVELPDEFQDMSADAQASYLETYTAQVLPEIKAEKERERLKQAWGTVAGQYGIDPNVPPEFIDDLIAFKEQRNYEQLRQDNRLAQIDAETQAQFQRNKDYFERQENFAELKNRLENQGGVGSISPEKQMEAEMYRNFMAQKDLSADQLMAGYDDIPEIRQLAELFEGKPGALKDFRAEALKQFGPVGLEGLMDRERERQEELEDELDSKKSKRPKKPSKPTISVQEMLNPNPERPRGFAHDPSF